jgi:prephenate dehydratase
VKGNGSTASTQRARSGARVHVAYQGIAGAFGEEVVERLWRGEAVARPVRTFPAALDAVLGGSVAWAVIPVWNSRIGRVASACDALDDRARALVQEQEVLIPIELCLLGLLGTSIADVRYVGSHPAALAQCARLFGESPALLACEAFDTAGAAMELSRFCARTPNERPWYARLPVEAPSQLGAIAAAAAARRYGLEVLRRGVQDDPANMTRFVVVRAREETAA